MNDLAHLHNPANIMGINASIELFGKDVPPYALAGRKPLSYAGINIVGLRRRGFTAQQIDTIKRIYNVIYQSNLNVSDACKKIEAEFEESVEKRTILDFINRSKRGIIRFNPGGSADE